MRVWENRTLRDASAVLALIPFIVAMFINLSDQSISEHYGTLLVKADTDNSNLTIMSGGIAAIFSALGFVLHGLFWFKMTRIIEYVKVFTRVQAQAIAFVAMAGLLIVGFVAEGWIVFAIAQLAVAYTLYKAEVLPNFFGIATAVLASASIYFSVFGGSSSDAPVFLFIAWSIVITAFSVSDGGHPEERALTLDRIIQRDPAGQIGANEADE
jgi:hypothetical protein